MRSLPLRPGDSLTIPKMAVSMGFRASVSLRPAIQATGLLAPAPTGLTPAERVSLRWTHDGMKRLASPPAAWTAYQRTRLDRELVVLPTAYGPITFKASRLGGRPLTVTPEFKEVRRIAREKWLAVREVLEQARADGRQALERWLGS